MDTLIIYDNEGIIFSQISGDFIIPNGIQHIITEIPQGKYAISVDVENQIVIFEDYPKSDIEILREQLQQAQEAIDFLVMGGM